MSTAPASASTPRRARVLAWLGYCAAWLLVGAWQGSNVVIGHHASGDMIEPWQPLTWEVSSTLTTGLIALLIYRFERRWPVTGARAWRRLPAHLLAAFVYAALHTLGMVGLRKLVYALVGSHYDFGNPWIGYAYEFQKDLISYGIIVVVCVLLRVSRQRRERELAVVKLERDLIEARLAQLTAQVEPHFVFNTLNAISNRMHEDVEAADRMVADFAELLRASLVESGSTTVRVADDALWLRRYLDLMQERYRGQLDATIEVDPAVLDARMPRLLLQPLVENALQHGLKSGRGRLAVRIAAADDRLRCSVEDDGVGIAADAAPRVGLANVRRRLELLFPDAHRFELAARAEGGTRALIEIPLQHG